MNEYSQINEDDPILSLISCTTNAGYRIETRVPDSVKLSTHPQPGIAATTGNGGLSKNIYSGPCLISPFDSTALEAGYNPLTYDPEAGTGEPFESYDEFVSDILRGGGIPRVSQVVDHWGITGKMDGTVVLVLEDEEWTDKISRKLGNAGIEFDRDQVFEDVHDTYYEVLFKTFERYVNDVLENDVDIVPIFTSDYSDEIDQLLDDATDLPNVGNSFDEEERYVQRINMYTTALWLDYIEKELGLSSGSLDISDPIRYYDELFNYEGNESNIFRDYQVDYFSRAPEDREYELHIVPPILAPFREGYDFERNRVPHEDAIIPQYIDSVLKRLNPANDEDVPDLLRLPLVRALSGFPNLADEALDILHLWEDEREQQSEWKREAKLSVVGHEIADDQVQREPGIKIRQAVQESRQQFRASAGESDTPLLESTYEAVASDLKTLLDPVRDRT